MSGTVVLFMERPSSPSSLGFSEGSLVEQLAVALVVSTKFVEPCLQLH